MKIDFSDRFYHHFICGASGSGKTWLANYLAYIYSQQGEISGCLIFSGTGQFSKEAASFKFVDKKYQGKYSNYVLSAFLERIEKNLKANIVHDYLLILDDVASLRGIWDAGGVFLELMCNYRHYKIHVISIAQNAVQYPPQVRNNITMAYIFPPLMGTNIKYIYDIVGGSLTKKEFLQLLEGTAKQQYRLLVWSAIPRDHKYFGTLVAPAKIPDFKLNS